MRSLPYMLTVAILVAFSASLPTASAETLIYPSTRTLVTGTETGGIAQLQVQDGLSHNVSEVDTTGDLNVQTLLVPDGDFSVDWSAYGCDNTSAHYACVDEHPNDGNTTIIVSPSVSPVNTETLNLSDMPTDVTVDSLSGFFWARQNQTLLAGLTTKYKLQPSEQSCDAFSYSSTPFTQVFANITLTSETTGCDGGPWDPEDINNLLWDVTKSVPSVRVTITNIGVIVQYDDRDYAADVRYGFDLSGLQYGTAKVYVTGRITVTADNFDVYAQQCSDLTWELLRPNPFIAAFSDFVEFGLQAFDCSGTLNLRFLSSDPNDETGITLVLDYLAVSLSDFRIGQVWSGFWALTFVGLLVTAVVLAWKVHGRTRGEGM